jgi:hypothetical protein
VGGVRAAVTQGIAVNWGAPVKTLAFGSFTAGAYNATYAQFSAPVSFTDNSAFLTLSGTATGSVFDTNNNQVGSVSALSLTATPGQTFSSTLTGFVKLSSAANRTFVFHLTFNTPFGTVTRLVTVGA